MVEVLTMKEWENLPIAREYRDKVIEECARRIEAFLLDSEGKIRDADAIDDYAAAIRALKT